MEADDKNKFIAVIQQDNGFFGKEKAFKYINTWDFIILFIAIFLRLVFVLNLKNEELTAQGKNFDFSKYWDFKHLSRWTIHVLSSLLIILVLPELFVDIVQKRYFSELTEWTLFSSGVVGFLGYDSIKIFEKAGLLLLSKVGIKLKNESD